MTSKSEARSQPKLHWAMVGFALSLLLPSTAVIQRYLGIVGVAGYLLVASLALLLFVKVRYSLARFASSVTRRQVLWLAASSFLLVLIAFVLVYPVADSGILGGGSDNDDALDIATTELLHGRYPYTSKTYMGNLPAQLPGALLLAAPFVRLGRSAYQNLFWLLAFVIVMTRYFRDGRLALILLWTILALSPVVLYQVLVGSDHIANSLYVLLAVLWMMWAVSRPGSPGWKGVAPAIFLGIALASRANFFMLLPLILSAMIKTVGWKAAITYAAIVGTTILILTVPFYLYDPQGFSPLDAASKLGQFETVLPFAGILLPLATGIIALIMAFLQPERGRLDTLLRNCAIVLAFPVLCGTILLSGTIGKLNFSFASYGTFFLFFGAVAFWRDLFAGTALEVA
jgi:hypothetical protein